MNDLFGNPQFPKPVLKGLPPDWNLSLYEYFWGSQSEVVGKKKSLDFNENIRDRSLLEVWDEGTWKKLYGPPQSGRIYRLYLNA